MRILVVEDDRETADALAEALGLQAYAVDLAPDGKTAERLMAVNHYDLVLLDWSIPPPTGLELLRQWRATGHEVPVLMLTGHRDVAHRVGGLDSGADDYLVKPFSFAELSARVRSLLRRREKTLQSRMAAEDVELDRAAHRVTVGGRAVHLSPKEFALLEYLMSRLDEVVSRTTLSEHVWSDGFDPSSNVIDVLLHRLRKKIDGSRPKALLHTVPGVGYVLRSRRS